ncbi:hypothetical protein DFH09DRAFT_1284682 [Mycena vulgaris]|nr:hypothetical protein DFH09DRAFT_1284682 [Mycena vulgaris]
MAAHDTPLHRARSEPHVPRASGEQGARCRSRSAASADGDANLSRTQLTQFRTACRTPDDTAASPLLSPLCSILGVRLRGAVDMASDDESGSGLHSGVGCLPEGTGQGTLATAEGSRTGCPPRREEDEVCSAGGPRGARGSAQASRSRTFWDHDEISFTMPEVVVKGALADPPPAHALPRAPLRIRPCVASMSSYVQRVEDGALSFSFTAWRTAELKVRARGGLLRNDERRMCANPSGHVEQRATGNDSEQRVEDGALLLRGLGDGVALQRDRPRFGSSAL